MEERPQREPATSDIGDGTADTIGSSQRGAIDDSLAPVGRTETAETIGHFQGGGVDVPLAPEGWAESNPGLASAADIDQGNGDPRRPVEEGSTRAQQLGTAPRDSTGPDQGQDPTPGG